MLFCKDLGGRHESRLVAAIDCAAGGERGDDGLATADITLQQTPHRMRRFQVACNFGKGARLGRCQTERQTRKQACFQRIPGGRRKALHDRRRLIAPRAVSALERQLLRQDFVEFHAPPSRRIASVGRPRRREVQCSDGGGKLCEIECGLRRRRVAELPVLDGIGDGTNDDAPQGTLPHPCGGGINRRQRLRQRRVFEYLAVARMDHLGAEESAARIARGAQASADGQRLDLAAVKIEKAQQQDATGVGNAHDQRAARPVGNLRTLDDAFDLREHTIDECIDWRDPGFILVA